MWHSRIQLKIRHFTRPLWVMAALVVGGSTLRADVVDDLANALQTPTDEIASQDADVHAKALAARAERVQKRIDALRTITELRRALALQEWNDNPNNFVLAVDIKLRKEVGERFAAAVREVIKTGDANSKLAVANMIAEMGPEMRATAPDEKAKLEAEMGFARQLTADVVQLTEDKNRAVRQEALRALGNILPKDNIALPIFQRTLENGPSVGERRLAADGLLQMVKNVDFWYRKSPPLVRLEARRYMLETAAAVVRTSAAGAKDSDPQVRVACNLAVQAAAQAIGTGDQIPEAFKRNEFPRDTGNLSKEDQARIAMSQGMVVSVLKALDPQLKTFQEQTPVLTHALGDPDEQVRLSALQALEAIGIVRVRLKRLVVSVPEFRNGDKEGEQDPRALLAAEDPFGTSLKSALAKAAELLHDRDVAVRRAAVDFLEVLESSATPVAGDLATSLADPDRFVRWGAARTLANLPPDKAAVAVPGLAKLLLDTDLGLRIEAAKTLTALGPYAEAAAPALAKAIVNGDVEGRTTAMEALQSLGPNAGKVAVPELIENLSHPDPRVRRAAAKTLGGFGPAAAAAIPALRRGLGDDDQEVRVNASDAMLNILAPAKR